MNALPSSSVTLVQPRTVRFGVGVSRELAEIVRELGVRRPFVVCSPSQRKRVDGWHDLMPVSGIFDDIRREPDYAMCLAALEAARSVAADGIVAVGGGSPMDVGKLVAVLLDGSQTLGSCVGISNIRGRAAPLICVPTTAGSGSEVSPNALLIDPADGRKKGFVSPHLVADAALVDPELTVHVPPAVTASTGMDALTHCIEAFTSRFAHPLVDAWAIAGIEQIGRSLRVAVKSGDDLSARTDVALGSLMGGLCLGPVNTGAVHALAYPLGTRFGVSHGTSNAVLLPHVLRFNRSAAPQRYAQLATPMGLAIVGDVEADSLAVIDAIARLSRDCGIPPSLSALGVPRDSIGAMADEAMTITRLLDRNIRTVSRDDAVSIYESAFA